MAVTLAQLETLYLAYFGRPADFDGLQFYTTGAQSLEEVGTAFANSAESRALYGSGYGSAFVNAIYVNLFGRDAEAGGLAYWVGQLATGAVSPAAAALAILNAAQGADAVAIRNKLAAATQFTQGLDNPTDILAYQGNVAAAAARGWLLGVDADAGTLAAAVARLPALVAHIERVGGEVGQDWALTRGIDTFTMPVATLVDTVRGIVDFSGGKNASTFSSLDAIHGNGRTIVDVFLADTTGGTPDRVVMTNVAQFNVTVASNLLPDVAFDARDWDAVYSVSLGGPGALSMEVDDLVNATPRLRVQVEGGTFGGIRIVDAMLGSFEVQASIESLSLDPVGAIATLGSAGLGLSLGDKGGAMLEVIQSRASAVADAVVGDFTLGDVSLHIGETARAPTIHIGNFAQATGHAATVGNVSLGDIVLSSEALGQMHVTLSAHAEARVKGAATAGDVSLGDVRISSATGASVSLTLFHSAASVNGAVSVGNLLVGDQLLDGAGQARYVLYDVVRTAKGAASAGDLVMGDLSIAGTGASQTKLAAIYLTASSLNGPASVGDIVVGDVSVQGCSSNGAYFYNLADSLGTGDAIGGNVRVGDILLRASGTGTNVFSAYNTAHVDGTGGDGSVGNITLGNVSLVVASSSNDFNVYNDVFARHGTATVGNITLGDITLSETYGDSGFNQVKVKSQAVALEQDAGTGRIFVGDVRINAGGITQASALNEITLYNNAVATAGAASAGGISVGNVLARTGYSGYAYLRAANVGSGGASSGSNGIVTVGNVAMDGSLGAYLILDVENRQNVQGSVGGIAIGDVQLAANLQSGYATLTALDRAGSVGNAGNISVGNIALQGATVSLTIDNRALGGSVGNVSVGNMLLQGDGGTHTGIRNVAGDGDAGNLALGNVKVTAAVGQEFVLQASNVATAGTVGSTVVGNITLQLTNKDAGGMDSIAGLQVYTDTARAHGGDIVLGNIDLSAGGVTAKGAFTGVMMRADMNIASMDGTITIGNISASGGVKDANGHLSDNFDDLANWLVLFTSAPGRITVGNIDYSAYAASATLDVHSWAGAAVISGAKGGGTITDNKGGNAIVLNAAAKADVVHFQSVQGGVVDAGGVVTAAQAALDSITGFGSGDRFDVVGGILGNGALIQNTPAQTFAQFLVHAENQITKSGNSAYVAVIGGETYVALNTGGKVGEIVKLAGVHTFSWDTGALVFAS